MAGRKTGAPRRDVAREVDGEPAKRPGPAPWQPTATQREQIEQMAARGVPIQDIAIMVGVDRDTLKLRAQDLVDAGRANGITTITGSLFREAQKGSYKHQALYLQHVAGWKTRTVMEHKIGLEALVADDDDDELDE